MSPSYIRSSSDSNVVLDNVEVYCNNGDMLLSTDFVRKRIEERNYFKVSKVFHQNMTKEKAFGVNFLQNQFESSILQVGLPIKKQTEFIIPSVHDHQVETPVILIGYPHRPSKAYLRNTYENPPEKKEFNAFFTYYLKTASIGKIKSSNSNFLLVSCATCSAMSGSPVFSLNGDLIGFLLGSKKCFTYNNAIVLSVNHPTFVIEYLSYAGYELLITEKEKYLPLLTPYISKHHDLIMKEINSNILKETVKENLRRVLDVFNSQ